jgi:hypothetical protein
VRDFEEFDEWLASTLLPRQRAARQRDAELQERRRAVRLPWTPKLVMWGAGILAALWLDSALPLMVGFMAPLWIDFKRIRKVPGRACSVRDEFLKPVIEFWNPSFQYAPWASDMRGWLSQSRLVPESFDRAVSSDLVSGKLGATSFRFAEFDLQSVGKENETRTVVKGVLFEADANKHFRSSLFALPDASEAHLGIISRAWQSLQGRAYGRLIHLEDPDFEMHFKVYGSDPVEARYLLSPTLMRRLVEIRENHGCPIRVGFVDGKLHVVLELDKDFFVVPPIERVDARQLKQWAGELHTLVGLVEELDLNTRVWSKGAGPE